MLDRHTSMIRRWQTTSFLSYFYCSFTYHDQLWNVKCIFLFSKFPILIANDVSYIFYINEDACLCKQEYAENAWCYRLKMCRIFFKHKLDVCKRVYVSKEERAAKFRPLLGAYGLWAGRSLLCLCCCDTGPRFLRPHPRHRPIKSPSTTSTGQWWSILTRIPREVANMKSTKLHLQWENEWITQPHKSWILELASFPRVMRSF